MKLITSFWNLLQSHFNSHLDIHSAGFSMLVLVIGIYFLRKKPEATSVKATKAKKKAQAK